MWYGGTGEHAGEQVRLSPATQFTHWHQVHNAAEIPRTPHFAFVQGPYRSAEQVAHALFVVGSLRGTELDGDWGVDAQGQVQPSRELRRRFDQLLTTQGEVTREELGIWLRNRTTLELDPLAAQAVMQIWQQYLLLEGQAYRYAVRINEPETLRWALQERQLKRRELLGQAWADAFFADEEAQLLHILSPRDGVVGESKLNRPTVAAHGPLPELSAAQAHAVRREQFDAAAAQRLADLDREDRQWQQRLQLARLQWGQTSGATHLSEAQQQASFGQWLDGHFDANERLRVRALLGL